MASKKSNDITKTGHLSYRDLRTLNAFNQMTGNTLIPVTEDDISQYLYDKNMQDQTSGIVAATSGLNELQDRPVSTSIAQNSNNGDFWGNSFFDPDIAVGGFDINRLSDIRAENQPWFSKLINGVGKAGVLAATTALETAGLIYGLGQGAYNAYNAEDGDGGKAFLHGLWDNPITQVLQKVNEVSEELMPNYYTQEEQEGAFDIFSANFLGDKLIKNLGFMVGAFYGGMPFASGIGKIGQNMVRGAREAQLAERMGMARRARDIYREGNNIADAAQRQAYIDSKLASEGLTEVERGARMKAGLDHINKIAGRTRAATQTVGTVGAAVNEGAIEAINNSKDWAQGRIMRANDDYNKRLAELDAKYSELGYESNDLASRIVLNEQYEKEREEIEQRHQLELADIEKGRATMGNADLLMNLPILLASNAYQLGHLYTRGFESTRRQMGSIWNGHKLAGDLKKGTLDTDKTLKKAWLSSLYKKNTEGVEELTQRMASDASGNAVDNAIDRHLNAGKNEEFKVSADDYIAGMGKSISENLQNPQAWEEYFIGAVSAMVGMPVFGSQTKNAYAKLGPVGLQGGLIGDYQEYKNAMEREKETAEYLNGRVKDPKFKALYDNLRKQHNLDAMLEDALINRDKKEYKDLEFEKLFQDISAAASSGHLAEFKELINYDGEYTDEDLEDLVKTTTKRITPEEQKNRDKYRQQWLKDRIEAVSPIDDAELAEVNTQIVTGLQRLSAIEEAISPDRSEALPIEEYQRLQAEHVTTSEALEALRKKRDKILSRTPDQALLEQYSDEYDIISQRLADENSYQEDILEGPFVNVNGEMTINDEAKEEMKNLLERNKKTINNAIDNYLKIRNDIDIETDGRLKDKDLAFLTWMKAKILNYEERSADMADELVEGLPALSVLQEKMKSLLERHIEKVQAEHDAAVENQKKVSEDKKVSDKKKEAAENAVQEAKKRLDAAKSASRYNDYALKLLEMLTEEKETTKAEKRALDRGYGRDEEGKTYSQKYDNSTRAINSDEAQGILAHPLNFQSLMKILEISGLDDNVREKLMDNASDLFILANEKKAYNKKLREFLGDPTLINDAYRNSDDKLTQQEKDNKISDLALRISKAKDLTELDAVMREVNMNPEILQSAVQKAKQEGDETTKKFLDDYQGGFDFMADLHEQLKGVSDEQVAAGLYETLDNAWNYAMSNGTDVQKSLKDYLDAAIKGFEESGNKEHAKALKGILKDLDIAHKSSATNKKAKSGKDNTEKKKEDKKDDEKASGDTEPEEDLSKFTDGGGSLTERLKRMKEEENKPDTKETLDNAIKEELKEAKNKKKLVDRISKLSNSLQERIKKFNEGNPDAAVNDAYIREVLQTVNDEIENKNNNITVEDSGDNYEETRAEQMVKNLNSTFKSDGQATQFMIYDSSGSYLLDYTIPYHPRDDREAAIQRILSDYLAYQFVNKNYLGYIARSLGQTPKIHLLRSTEHGLNGQNPVTFLAIEIGEKERKAIGRLGFNNPNANLEGEIRTVPINGKDYQVIGILSINSTASGINPEVAEAFGSIQNALDRELHEAVLNEKQKEDEAQPFVMSEHTLEIDHIYTGRLEKFNDADDEGDKVSLHTFLTSAQDESGEKKRRTSTEYDPSNRKAVEFPIAVVVNRSISDNAKGPAKGLMVEVNADWVNKNNGAVLMFIPKPDGGYYPVRCTRRSVKAWLESGDIDGMHASGRALLEAVLDKENPVKNGYLGSILGYLETLFNDESSFADKLEAKNKLAKYFMFGETNPIHIDETTNTVSLRLGDTTEFDGGDDFKENAVKFFEAVAESGTIKFSIPSPSLESIESNAIIASGVLEIGLRGFYNFNANFTMKPMRAVEEDGKIKLEEVKLATTDAEEGSHFTRTAKERMTKVSFNMGSGEEIYYIEDGVVYDKDYNLAPEDKAAIVSLINSLGQDTPSCITTLLSRMGYNDKTLSIIASEFSKYKSTYVKELDGEDWVVMIGGGVTQVFKLNSDRGREFFNPESNGGQIDGKDTDGSFQKEARRIAKKALEKLKKEAKRKKDEPEASPEQPTSKEEAETLLRSAGKQMQDAINTSKDLDELTALVELGQAAIKAATEAGVGGGLIKNVTGILKGLTVKRDHLKKASPEPGPIAPSTGEKGSSVFSGVTETNINEAAQTNSSVAKLLNVMSLGGKVYAVAQKVLQYANSSGLKISDEEVSKMLDDIWSNRKSRGDLKKAVDKLDNALEC